MADTIIKLRPEPGKFPFEEIDVTVDADMVESSPDDLDASVTDLDGNTRRVKKAMHRRIRLDMQKLSVTDADVLRRWKHNRIRVALNPNWNGKTTLLSVFNRYDPITLSPGSIIGPVPVFTRTLSDSGAFATQKLPSGQYRLLQPNTPRYEDSIDALGVFYPATGLKLYGNCTNYAPKSLPQSGTLVWTLTNTSGNAGWAWSSTQPSFIEGMSGAGIFLGQDTDYLSFAVASYGGAGQVSAGVWLRGEGQFNVQMTGGATATGSTANLLPDTWTLVKVENATASGSSITLRLNSKQTFSWCNVGGVMFQRGRQVTGYIHNLATTSPVTQQEDAVYYPFQVSNFPFTIHVGIETPQFMPTSGEHVLFGVDSGGGNRMVLKYDAALAKFYFQKKTSGANAQWTPARGSNKFTVISITVSRDLYLVYENGVNVASATPASTHSLPFGFNVGWDGITDTNGWGGLIHFLRIDDAFLDTSEIAYISDKYNLAQNVELTRMAEGRLFEIDTPEHKIRAGQRFCTLELKQCHTYKTATREEP